MNKGLGWWNWLTIFFGIYIFSTVLNSAVERLTGTDKVTVYYQYCKTKDLHALPILDCDKYGGQWKTATKTYHVNFPNQRVDPQSTYSGRCDVFDTENWFCHYKNDETGGVYYMQDGQYQESSSKGNMTLPVSFIHYLYLRLTRES
jgi:hypothetical protein